MWSHKLCTGLKLGCENTFTIENMGWKRQKQLFKLYLQIKIENTFVKPFRKQILSCIKTQFIRANSSNAKSVNIRLATKGTLLGIATLCTWDNSYNVKSANFRHLGNKVL